MHRIEALLSGALVVRGPGLTGPVGSVFLVTAFLHNKVLSCTSTASPRPTIGGIMPGTPFRNRPLPWRRTFRADPTIIIETINRGGFFPVPATPPNMSTPATGVGTDVPGGLGDPGIGTIISTMNVDQRLYWGVVIFCVLVGVSVLGWFRWRNWLRR